MTRRDLLVLAGACPLFGQAPAPSSPAENLSYPLQSIEGTVTPVDMFFVRDHFNEPQVSLRTWRLKIEGRVSRPIEVSLADLIESPARKLEAVLECAGNAPGGSAVSNGVWEGVPMPDLLRAAGVEPGATKVLLEGADMGRLASDSPELPYCQIVPLEKCMRPESLVAFKLNDAFLPRKNGFPARALFPGWYGMDSVKWLQRIRVLGPEEKAGDFEASGMNQLYNRVLRRDSGEPQVTRLSELSVKSSIAWPPANTNLPAGRYAIRGFAWAGSQRVSSVEISRDGGRVWVNAKVENPSRPFTWVRWNSVWDAAPGDYILMSRATDTAGHVQPLKRDPARKDGYGMDFSIPLRCAVR